MTHNDDDQLAARALGGDLDAFATILERNLHPAWRIALAASPTAAAAEEAVVTGICDGVLAHGRHPDATLTLRTRVAAAVRRAACDADLGARPAPGADPVLAAFTTLPAASRVALWLIEVEGGTPAQVAPVLGLDRAATESLADRASTALRERIAADAAAQAAGPNCARALGKLPAHAAGRLTDDEREAVSLHLAGCGSCASRLATAVSPRAALRRLVTPVPAGLAAAVTERWARPTERDGMPWLRAWNERAVGAAAAVVLALGLAGATLAGRDDEDPDTEFAAPVGALNDGDDDDTAASTPLPPAVPAPAPSGVGVASAGSGRDATSADGAAGDRSRDGGRLPTPTTQAATPQQPRATPSPTTPTTQAPSGGTPAQESPVPAPSVPETGTQVTVELPGVTIGLGDDTGIDVGGTPIGDAPEPTGEPTIEITLPGLPPISLLP